MYKAFQIFKAILSKAKLFIIPMYNIFLRILSRIFHYFISFLISKESLLSGIKFLQNAKNPILAKYNFSGLL